MDFGGNGNTPIPWTPFYRVVIVLLLSCYVVAIVVLVCCYCRVTVLLWCCYGVVMSVGAHVLILHLRKVSAMCTMNPGRGTPWLLRVF